MVAILDHTATANAELEASVHVPISPEARRVIQETQAITIETGTISHANYLSDFFVRHTFNPDQAWFWMPEWQEAEASAAAEYANGLGKVFANEDEFLADLDR